jgi:hypothetical protein
MGAPSKVIEVEPDETRAHFATGLTDPRLAAGPGSDERLRMERGVVVRALARCVQLMEKDMNSGGSQARAARTRPRL